MSTRESRRRAQRQGRWAESICVALLRLGGHGILARGFRSPVGEIDIIARRGRALVFVEVKTRSDPDTAAAAVTPRQKRRITRAASLFLAKNPKFAQFDARFDVMLITRWRWPVRLRNAWSVDEYL